MTTPSASSGPRDIAARQAHATEPQDGPPAVRIVVADAPRVAEAASSTHATEPTPLIDRQLTTETARAPTGERTQFGGASPAPRALEFFDELPDDATKLALG